MATEKRLLKVQSIGTRYVKFVANTTIPGYNQEPRYNIIGKLDIITGEYSPKNLLSLTKSYQVIGPAAHFLAEAKTPVDSLLF